MFLLLPILGTATTGHASADSTRIAALVDSADRKGLAESPAWIALGHWRGRPGAWSGDVLGGYFYLDSVGATDPGRELHATLRALLSKEDISPFARDTTSMNMHPLVKFRARLRLLRDSLGISDSDLPAVDTSRWGRWHDGIRPNSATIAYAASYMGNPASVFGHALLRFDAPDRGGRRQILNYGVTYGASMPPGDPLYAVKGLLGLYYGFYGLTPYYIALQKYKYLESRDLWEYPLLLDSLEVETLLEHVWELGAARNRYLFFNGNCSNRLLDLLDAIRPGSHLSRDLGFPAFPLETVRLLQAKGVAGKPTWRPSVLSVFKARRDGLDPRQAGLMRKLVHGDTSFSVLDSAGLSAAQVAEAQDAALEYLAWKVRDVPKADRARWLSLQDGVLLQRTRFPSATPFDPPPSDPPPEASHRGWRATLSSGSGSGSPWLGFGLRMALHSLDDRPTGIPDGALVEGLAFDARVPYRDPGGFVVRRFDIIRVLQASPFDRDIPKPSWSLRVGLVPVEMRGGSVLSGNVQAGYGLCLGSRALRGWVLAEARGNWAPWKRASDAAIGPQLRAGMLALGGEDLGLLVEGTLFRSILFVPVSEALLDVDGRWSISRDFDLRLGSDIDQNENWNVHAGAALHF